MDSVTIETRARQVVIERPNPSKVAILNQRGPPGRPGADGGAVVTYVAAETLGGQRLVALTATGLRYASNDDIADAQTLLGLTIASAVSGSQAQVAIGGEQTEGSWTWTPDLPLFLGLNGLLTHVVPSAETGATFIQQVAVAVSATKVFINLRPPILLI